MGDFVLVNDIHLRDRPPVNCTDTYLDDLFDLLEQIARLAQSLDAPIILAGDVFDCKTPSRNSHGTVMRLIDWARQALVPVYAVPGNHDLLHDRLASLHESQPLGVVFASGAIQMLDGWIDEGAGEFVYGVPWLMTFDKANVADALADFRYGGHPVSSNSAHLLVVTHAPLYPPGKELKYEFYPAAEWAEAMDNRGTVHYGHVHDPHGIYQVNGVTFSNPGALSRGSLTEHNLNRIPAVAIWNSDTGQIRHHELKAKPADEVFRLAEAQAVRAAEMNLSGFLDSVKATRLDITSIDAVLDHVRSTSTDEALNTVIAKLLAEVAQ